MGWWVRMVRVRLCSCLHSSLCGWNATYSSRSEKISQIRVDDDEDVVVEHPCPPLLPNLRPRDARHIFFWTLLFFSKRVRYSPFVDAFNFFQFSFVLRLLLFFPNWTTNYRVLWNSLFRLSLLYLSLAVCLETSGQLRLLMMFSISVIFHYRPGIMMYFVKY